MQSQDNQTDHDMASDSHGIRVHDSQGVRDPDSQETRVASTRVANNHGIRATMVQAYKLQAKLFSVQVQGQQAM